MAISYFQILQVCIYVAASNPALFKRLWDAFKQGYQAGIDIVTAVKNELPEVPLPRDFENSDTVSVEELELETQLRSMLVGEGAEPRAFGDGRFKKILLKFAESPIGQAFLQHYLSKITG